MRLSLLVACSANCVIGRDGGLPWRLSADLKRFKALTMGHPLLMGRKTFDGIGRPLPGRTSIVISRTPLAASGSPQVRYVGSLPQAIELAREISGGVASGVLASGSETAQNAPPEAFIVGGGEIYRQALPLVDRLYLTLVEGEVLGDTYFPEIDFSAWRLVQQETHPADEKNDFPSQFCVYDRIPQPAASI